MTIDAIAAEPHFVDHLAPVWLALPSQMRGRFLVDPALVDRARSKGIDPEPFDVDYQRRTPQMPPRTDGPPCLVASIGDIKVGRRLGYGPFAFLEHGAGQSYGGTSLNHSSYAGGPDRDDNELILVPNEYCASTWRKAYPDARVEVVGCPRLDGLPKRERETDGARPGSAEPPKLQERPASDVDANHSAPSTAQSTPVVAFSFHWPAPLAVSGYAGTALGDYLTDLPKVAARFAPIGHAHPKGDWPARMERQYNRAGIPFVADFDDVLRQADVYVCDNSSTLFEFAATGRPVVVLNAKHWHRQGSVGGRFWDWAGVGVNVWPGDDVAAAIERALEAREEDVAERERVLDLVYPVRSGGAALAARAIGEWLASKVEVAA